MSNGKYVLINGRLIPLIGGGAPEGEGDSPQPQDNPQPEPRKEPEPGREPLDVEAKIQEELDRRAKELGFESWDDLQSKHLERLGRYEEIIEKTKEKYSREAQKAKEEAERYRRMYEETILRSEIRTRATEMGAVDPDVVYELMSRKAEVKDGKVLVDGKSVEEALKELFEQKPYLVKASGKEGSGAGHQAEPNVPENLSPQERLKLAFRRMKNL